MFWQTTRFELDLTQPLVMGIVNLTPDSFSDAGAHAQTATALAHAQRLLQEGAGILDVGGESTRPGAQPITAEQEWQRIAPFLQEALRWQVPISVDTYHAPTMQRALDMGVDIINDIWALRQAGAEDVCLASQAGVCIMHMHGEPATMQVSPMDGDAVPQVALFLTERRDHLLALGMSAPRIMLDPGIGFGKTVEQNFSLLQRQRELLAIGPVLAGWSRKSSLGAVTGLPVDQRMVPSVTAAVLAAERGASVLRVHDVAATVAALSVWRATDQPADQLSSHS